MLDGERLCHVASHQKSKYLLLPLSGTMSGLLRYVHIWRTPSHWGGEEEEGREEEEGKEGGGQMSEGGEKEEIRGMDSRKWPQAPLVELDAMTHLECSYGTKS